MARDRLGVLSVRPPLQCSRPDSEPDPRWPLESLLSLDSCVLRLKTNSRRVRQRTSMDDLSPEAILGIAAACVAGLVGLGALTVRFACPRVFAAHFGIRAPKTTHCGKTVVLKDDTVIQISQNPIVLRAHTRALPHEVDLDSFLKVQRLKREFKPATLSNGGAHGHRDGVPRPPLDG